MYTNFDRNLTEFWWLQDSNDSVARPSKLSTQVEGGVTQVGTPATAPENAPAVQAVPIAPSGGSAKSTRERLQEFKELFDDGIITEEDFIKKKEEIIKSV